MAVRIFPSHAAGRCARLAIAAMTGLSLAAQPAAAGFQPPTTGTTGNDVLVGGMGSDLLEGHDGDDTLVGDPPAGDGTVVAVERVSTTEPSADGTILAASGPNFVPTFSSDGERIAFSSKASEFGAAASSYVVVVKSLRSGAVDIASSSSPGPDGMETPGESGLGKISLSPAGDKVAFISNTEGIVPGAPGKGKVVVKDLVSRTARNASSTAPDAGGVETAGNQNSYDPQFLPTGNAVAFISTASNLTEDPNGTIADVFVKNLDTGDIEIVTKAAPGAGGVEEPANGNTFDFHLGPGGTTAAFATLATNLAPDGPTDTNGAIDIYIKDRQSGAVALVSSSSPDPVTGDETLGDQNSRFPTISPDGRRVAFLSASGTFGGGAAGQQRLYIKDLDTRELTLVSTTTPDANGDSEPFNADIARYAFDASWSRVALVSAATNLGVSDPTSRLWVKNLVDGTVTLASTPPDGSIVTGAASDPNFSPDGRQLAFAFSTDELVSDGLQGTQNIFVATLPPGPGADDTLLGGPGDDRLVGGPGNDDLHGDANTDTAVYPGPRSRYVVTPQIVNGQVVSATVQDKAMGSPEGTDLLTDVEFLDFDGASPVPVGSPGPNNRAPILSGSSTVHVFENKTLQFELALSDPDGDPLTISILSPPSHGTASYVHQPYTTPEHRFIYEDGPGAESADEMTIRVADPWGGMSDVAVHFDIGELVQGTVGDDAVDTGDGSDLIKTSNGIDVIHSNGGDDDIDAGADDDIVFAGPGNDTVQGGSGNDTIDGGTGDDHMEGGAGDDVYVVDSAGDSVAEGVGGGVDEVRSSVSFTLPPNVEALTLTGNGAVSGTGNAGGNAITGNSAANVIKGLGGDDVVDGGGGADVLDGGAGRDTLTFSWAKTGVTVDLKTGRAGTARVRNFEIVVGTPLRDVLRGGAPAEQLLGGGGADKLEGRGGADRLTGGAGNDVFVYRKPSDSPRRKPDVITDFRSGDRIDLRAVDANSRQRRKQHFAYRGTRPFSGKPGQLRFRSGRLEADVDGDRRADLVIRLPGVSRLRARSLMLR